MSLKAFHVVFVTVATLLATGFGLWCLRQGGYPVIGLAAMATAAALIVYGVWFLKKTKGVSLL